MTFMIHDRYAYLAAWGYDGGEFHKIHAPGAK